MWQVDRHCDIGCFLLVMKSFANPVETALEMIREHGASAATEAIMFGAEMREMGDIQGWQFWQSVYRLICQIEFAEEQVSDALH